MKRNKNNKKSKFNFKDFRIYLLALLFIISLVLIIRTYTLHILPIKYFIPFIIIVLLLNLLMYSLQYSKRVNKFNRGLGKVLCILLSAALVVANTYIFKYASTIAAITGANKQTHIISVVVLKDDAAKKIEDLKSETFGVQNIVDKENTSYAVNEIQKDVGMDIATLGYDSYKAQADALYNKEVRVIIMNESARKSMEEIHEDFSDETKVIKRYEKVEEIKDISKDVDVTDTPFTIFISGIDTFGPVSTVSRSDVNLLMTINPNTHQVLLTSIPRDYYVGFSCLGGTLDKLTHSGIYGVDCTVGTIENLFNIDINYYARVNFSSLIEIIDAIGGVTVNSPNTFSAGGYSFVAGSNYLNGEEALAFSRERYSFAGGDRERGKNQMRVIEGIISKVASPAIISNYNSIMSAVSGSFETNMSSGEINSLVQMQLNEMSGWNVTQVSVDGTGGSDFAYSLGSNAYVMYPTQSTVDNAIRMINQVLNGETPTE